MMLEFTIYVEVVSAVCVSCRFHYVAEKCLSSIRRVGKRCSKTPNQALGVRGRGGGAAQPSRCAETVSKLTTS